MKPIGVFDSGYGGLTILKEFIEVLPQYDYLYLGDNARTPYGTRDFETVYQYTRQCVHWFFQQGCELVILACNTASAKALRTIQQNDLLQTAGRKRVLGVIRPTAEVIGNYSTTSHIGIFGTSGTVQSNSYCLEIEKFFPHLSIVQEACPMWVPLIENKEYDKPGADYFIKQHVDNLLKQDEKIDTILLACTHYPLLVQKIRKYISKDIQLISQGNIVAQSLKDYLSRHVEIEQQCSKGAIRNFCTTGSTVDFDNHASTFFGSTVQSAHVSIL
ncbi:MAG: glutamate racemase [Ferruginibacter sp.]|nr:glutamate racemase [Ferruginibacter sp.]